MFDFRRTINSTFKSKHPITLVLKEGNFIDGLYQETGKLETIITGSCMNMSGKDLKLLPENLRFEFSRQLFTTTEIPLDSDILYRDKRYKVILSEPYDDVGDSGHWKSILKLYSDGYNDADDDTVRDPTIPQTMPQPTNSGHYEDGVWKND